MEQKPADKDTSYVTVQDFTKEGKARWKKTSSGEKDNVAFCILCSARMKAVKVSVEAKNDMSGKDVNDCDNVMEEQTSPIELDSWDPFQRGGVIAPEGFTYIGKLSFICFGPTSKFFASTLAMGGQSNRTVEGGKEGLRKAQRKVNTERANMDREVGIDRGMTSNTRMQCAFMAQNEDDAVQRHRDMRMVMLTKSIELTERLVELKMKMSDRMGVEGLETHSLYSSTHYQQSNRHQENAVILPHHPYHVQVAQNHSHRGHYHHEYWTQTYPTSPLIDRSNVQVLRWSYAKYDDGDCMSN